MAQRYEARKDYFGNVILPPKNDEGELVLYSDYAALEQRFNALSTKFSAMVEENATLRKRIDRFKIFARFILEECDDWAMAHDAARKAMELKEGDNANSSHI